MCDCFCLCSIFFRSEVRIRCQVFFLPCFVVRLSLWCLCLFFLEYALPVPSADGNFHWLLFGPPPKSMFLMISGYLFPSVFTYPCLQIPGCLIQIQIYKITNFKVILNTPSLTLVLDVLLLHTGLSTGKTYWAFLILALKSPFVMHWQYFLKG